MNQSLFSSTSCYIDTFNSGLVDLLKHDSLGTFILCCANANFDARIFAATKDELIQQYDRFKDTYTDAFKQGQEVAGSEEDLLVFLKMLSIGFDGLEHTVFREEGPWEIQYNHLRSFRPKRMSGQPAKSIRLNFNEDGFHFNKAFIQKECFWEGELNGALLSLYYNKYPVVDYHGLLLPDRHKNLPQFLERDYHNYIWDLTEAFAGRLDGAGFGYNSYGAHASVNHLHFQMFLRQRGLPVMAENWRHNGGEDRYPAHLEVFCQREKAWSYITQLHAERMPYNLLYLPGKMLVFPRKPQGGYQQAEWSGGFSWYEMAGGTITFNRQAYEGISAQDIVEEFGKLRLEQIFNAAFVKQDSWKPAC